MNRPRYRTVLSLVALVAVVALAAIAAGCGEDEMSADETAVRAAITNSVQAVIDGDVDAYCASLSEEVKFAMLVRMQDPEADGPVSCEDVMKRLFEGGMSRSAQMPTITVVTVDGDSATAQAESGASFTLVRGENGAWLISEGRAAGSGDGDEDADSGEDAEKSGGDDAGESGDDVAEPTEP